MEIILKYFSDFTDKQHCQLKQLGPLYKDWNEKINLISRKDIESIYEKHILHSLSIAAVFEFTPGMQIMDLGTGGGFPGIPLAIYFPETHFHLVDSIGKKIKVVDDVCSSLGLKNVTTQKIRAEELKNQKYDFVVSRAVAPLKDLWKWSRPLFRVKNNVNSGLICLKGGDLAKEIAESNKTPRVYDLSEMFNESYFQEKYLLHIST